MHNLLTKIMIYYTGMYHITYTSIVIHIQLGMDGY